MSAAYPPPHYHEPNRAKLLRLMREQPLATFIVAADSRAYPTPLPLVIVDANTDTLELLGHLDANNPAAHYLKTGLEATAVFHGPSAYISPTDVTTRQLPTYNYEQVHVRGTLELVEDPRRIHADLQALVRAMEPAGNWTLAANDPRVAPLIPHIIAFRLHVAELHGRFKLSQDKRLADQAAAMRKLRTGHTQP